MNDPAREVEALVVLLVSVRRSEQVLPVLASMNWGALWQMSTERNDWTSLLQIVVDGDMVLDLKPTKGETR
jgi:hypothetical protein